MTKTKEEVYLSLITSVGLVSTEIHIEKLLRQPHKRFNVEKLINTIDKLSPNTGRIKALAILHCFGGQEVNIPSIESAKRLVRNELILKNYREGKTYTELAQEFHISERWIRVIINIMIYRRVASLDASN